VDRIGRVYFNKKFAGTLEETATGYRFTYSLSYLAFGTPLSFNLPLQEKPFESKHLFPFFDNLVSEGWLKEVQCRAQKIDQNDTLGLILANGKDMAGAVTVLRSNGDIL